MEVYIESVIFDNLVMDLLIIFLSGKILRLSPKIGRSFFAAIVGTIFSICLPFLKLHSIFLLCIKILMGAILSLLAFKSTTFKMFVLNFLVFFSVTAILGGVTFGLIYLFGGSAEKGVSLGNDIFLPMGVIYLFLFAYLYLLFQAFKYINKKKVINDFVFKTRLFYKDISIELNGFLDTGNNLQDPITKMPIIILNYKTFIKIFKDVPIQKVLMKSVCEKDISGSHYMKVLSPVGNCSQMLVFPIQKIEVQFRDDHKTIDAVMAGLSLAKIKSNFNCDILLNPSCF
ncbi:MAG: sigma-E processing peptidase SpoIIGA [Clostridia bacterium]